MLYDILMLPDGRRIFRDKEEYAELIKLLKDGYSFSSIARHFGADHTSVIWHARKLGYLSGGKGSFKRTLDVFIIPPNLHTTHSTEHKEQAPLPELPPKIIKDTRHPLLREKVNAGHSYQEYRDIEKKKKKGETLEQIIKRKLATNK